MPTMRVGMDLQVLIDDLADARGLSEEHNLAM